MSISTGHEATGQAHGGILVAQRVYQYFWSAFAHLKRNVFLRRIYYANESGITQQHQLQDAKRLWVCVLALTGSIKTL